MAADKKQARRMAGFVKPLRVPPGTKVDLADDFDPGYRAEFVEQGGRGGAPRRGRRAPRRLPGRLAAQDTRAARRPAGARRGRQGRDDPPRHERRQPAGRPGHELQGALGRGARPRLPLALRAAAAGPRRDRDLQPLALRGGARRPRAPGAPRPRELPPAAKGEATSGNGATARSTTGSATSATTASAS